MYTNVRSNIGYITSAIMQPTNNTKIISNAESMKKFAPGDVIIINPIKCGGGDYALANKISNLITKYNGKGKILSYDLDIRNSEKSELNPNPIREVNFSLDSDFNDDVKLIDPVIIIAPYGICHPKHLIKLLSTEKIKYVSAKRILMINEMDLAPQSYDGIKVENYKYEEALLEIGFDSIKIASLGFSEDAIGYLPTNEKELSHINNRATTELEKFLDGCNFNLDKNKNIYLSYLGGRRPYISSEDFLWKTINENKESNKDSIYIFAYRDKDSIKFTVHSVMKWLLDENPNKLFSECKLFCIENVNEQLKIEEIKNGKNDKIIGSGSKSMHIFFTGMMPENIFKDFIAISDSGMMTGDQSLSDYLSIKKEMPYYEVMPWKKNLARSIQNIANKMGDEKLDSKIKTKFIASGQIQIETKDHFPQRDEENKEREQYLLSEFNQAIFSRNAEEPLMEKLQEIRAAANSSQLTMQPGTKNFQVKFNKFYKKVLYQKNAISEIRNWVQEASPELNKLKKINLKKFLQEINKTIQSSDTNISVLLEKLDNLQKKLRDSGLLHSAFIYPETLKNKLEPWNNELIELEAEYDAIEKYNRNLSHVIKSRRGELKKELIGPALEILKYC